jgi:hypothetical protein
MKNYSPIYTILATMAVAAMAIGAEPVRHNKKLELSKSEAAKSGHEFVYQAADSRLIVVAIATAKARKRTG